MEEKRYVVLIVEDQLDLREGIKLGLEMEGYQVLTAASAEEALLWLERLTPDIIVADIMLPGMDGYDLFQRLREKPEWAQIPFLFLTAKGDPLSIRQGKLMGADDYLVKPFSMEDLLAAIQGRLRRAEELRKTILQQQGALERETGKIECGPFVIDQEAFQAWKDGELLELTPTEFRLLAALARNAGRVLSYTELIRASHGYEEMEREEARELLRPHLRNLRRKIDPDDRTSYIQNVRGVGYRLDPKPGPVQK